MIRPSTGSVSAILLVVGVLAFATVSIDRSNVERMSIVGNFDERQLESIKALLTEVDIASSEVEQLKQTLSAAGLGPPRQCQEKLAASD